MGFGKRLEALKYKKVGILQIVKGDIGKIPLVIVAS